MNPRWLDIAFGELWPVRVREQPGRFANPRIVEYQQITTLDEQGNDEVAWCSAFACWVMEQAGLPSTRSARARSWLQYGIQARFPHPGVIAVLKRADSMAGPDVLDAPGHVGFVVGLTDGGLQLLGGNQSDSVSILRFPFSSLLGLRVPGEVQGG